MARKSNKSNRRCRLHIESLEGRIVPSTTITRDAVDPGKFVITNDPSEVATITFDRVGAKYTLQSSDTEFASTAPGVTVAADKLSAEIDAAVVTSLNFALGNMSDSFTIGSGTADGFAPITVDGGSGFSWQIL